MNTNGEYALCVCVFIYPKPLVQIEYTSRYVERARHFFFVLLRVSSRRFIFILFVLLSLEDQYETHCLVIIWFIFNNLLASQHTIDIIHWLSLRERFSCCCERLLTITLDPSNSWRKPGRLIRVSGPRWLAWPVDRQNYKTNSKRSKWHRRELVCMNPIDCYQHISFEFILSYRHLICFGVAIKCCANCTFALRLCSIKTNKKVTFVVSSPGNCTHVYGFTHLPHAHTHSHTHTSTNHMSKTNAE